MAVSKRLRYEIFRRDKHTCQYCGRSAPEVKLQPDHVVPETLGGKTEPSNLVTACIDCNAGKSSVPADAPLIDAVSERAVAWSAAMKHAAAAMLRDLAARDEQRSEFEEAWDRWGRGEGEKRAAIPKDASWRQTVDQLTSAGLPIEVLLDCIPIAMTKQGLKDENIFRYMCGIAWNRVSELQQAAQQCVSEEQADPWELNMATGDGIDIGKRGLARELLDEHVPEPYQLRAMATAGRSAEEALEEGEEWTETDIFVEACRNAIDEAASDNALYRSSQNKLFDLFDQDDVELATKLAEREIDEFLGDQKITHALRTSLHADWLQRLTFFNRHSPAERMEWSACVATSRHGEIDDDHMLRLVRYAWDCYHSGFYALGSNCAHSGEHGAMCPTAASYAVTLEDCRICASSEENDCAGHHLCQRHTEDFVDGKIESKTTGKTITVRDYTPLAVVS